MKKTILPTFIILLSFNNKCFSQSIERQVINCFGNAVTASGIYFEQNAGEVLTQTYQNGGLWLLQGFLQPQKESVSTQENEEVKIKCPTPYPVPFQNSLEFTNSELLFDHVIMHDLSGKTVWEQKVYSNRLNFPIDIAEGAYILELLQQNVPLCSYKIVRYK